MEIDITTAPVPRKKEGRAARLAAMMDQDGPDAVCAALLRADGMMAMDQVEGVPTSDDTLGAFNYGESRASQTEGTPGSAAAGLDDAESDKENDPLSA
jgi:hypothetical protein